MIAAPISVKYNWIPIHSRRMSTAASKWRLTEIINLWRKPHASYTFHSC